MAGRSRPAAICGRLRLALQRSWQETITKQICGLDVFMFGVACALAVITAGCQAHAVWWLIARPG